MIGKRNATAIATLVERASGFAMRPGAGCRRATAIWSASTTSSQRMWSAIDQPTIRRE
jgi:hypothetical protein